MANQEKLGIPIILIIVSIVTAIMLDQYVMTSKKVCAFSDNKVDWLKGLQTHSVQNMVGISDRIGHKAKTWDKAESEALKRQSMRT
jgi:hypothetical protein